MLNEIQYKTERDLYDSQEVAELQKAGLSKWHLTKALKDSVNGISLSRVFHSIFVDRLGVGHEDETYETRKEYERISEDYLNVCPECLGKGTVTEYIPQSTRTRVRIMPITRKCRACKGKGFLSFRVDD